MIDIVVGVVLKNNQCLLTQRALDKEFGGLWEFPGGKIEETETPITALKRELQEEINLDFNSCEQIAQFNYSYPQKTIQFYVYLIQQFSGDIHCCEQQLAIRWVNLLELGQYNFPKANQRIIKKLYQLFATSI